MPFLPIEIRCFTVAIPLDEPAAHADLLVGVSLLLFKEKGPDFFLHTVTKNEREEQ